MDAPPDLADSAFRGTSRESGAPASWGLILACLAHGLEAPIAELGAGLDGLAAELAPDRSAENRAQIALIRDLGRSLSKLNRDYFDFAAVSSGAIQPRPRPTQLVDLFGQIDAVFAPLAARRRVEWSCRTDLQRSTVVTDPAWCQRLIACLLDNALRFTPEGGRVSLSGQSDDQGWSLWVSDTGPGFPPGLRARLARPHPSRTKLVDRDGSQNSGGGLGLSLVMALVLHLGGHYTLGNGPSGGAAVAVHFAKARPLES